VSQSFIVAMLEQLVLANSKSGVLSPAEVAAPVAYYGFNHRTACLIEHLALAQA